MQAMRLCYTAHAGQFDKGGVPYVFHPIHVAEQMDDEISTAAALLHDIIEDTPLTGDDLRDQGFPEIVVSAVEKLSRGEDESYMAYIDRIKPDDLARKIKLADLAHNSDRSRIPDPDEHVLGMWEKYDKAVKRLLEE